jgi:large subunit ribosomal protein L14e
MFEVGSICLKLAGRDAGLKCVIIDVIDHSYVMIDGQTRRKKCNVKHLEPTGKSIKIAKNAPESEIMVVFSKEGIEMRPKKKKAKAAKKPSRQRAKKEAPAKPEPKKAQ